MRCFYSVCVCVLAAGMLNPAAVAAPVLSFQPSGQSVPLQLTFSLDVLVTNVTDLFAFQFDVGFDPSLLRAGTITEGSFLSQGGATAFIAGAIDNASGTISATADTLAGAVPGVSGSGVLATIGFTSIGVGTSPLILSGATLLDSSLLDISFTTQPGAVTVGTQIAIPEARSVSLLAVGLGALSFVYWRCRRRVPSA